MFKDQVVAVTGAGGGIGRAIAEMFIAEGAKVAVCDLDAPEAVAAEIGARAYGFNAANEAEIKTAIDAIQADLGPIDIYVSNAGVGSGNGPHVAGGSNESWELAWQVNVMASVYAARALMPSWIARGSGRFVITASAAGLLNQIGSASYSATKHAAVSFAESIQIEHAQDGIRAHCICPQYVRTNMTKGMDMAENSKDGFLEPSDVAQALKASIEKDQFLVLSHPVVGDYFRHRAAKHDEYLMGMNKLRQKMAGETLPKSK